MVGLSSASLFPTKKWEAVTLGGTMRRKTQGAGIVKDWEAAFQIHLRKTEITRVRFCILDGCWGPLERLTRFTFRGDIAP